MEDTKRFYEGEAIRIKVKLYDGSNPDGSHTGVVAALMLDGVDAGSVTLLPVAGETGAYEGTGTLASAGRLEVAVSSNEGARWKSAPMYVKPFP